MSAPGPSYPPSPPGPPRPPGPTGYPTGHPTGAPTGAPTNALAWVSLGLGVLALLLCWIPFVNVLSMVLGLVAVVLGLVALGHRSRYGTGAVALGLGVAAGLVAVVLALVITVAAGRGLLSFLEDATGNAEPPEPSGSVREWVTDEDADLAFRVEDVTCSAADDDPYDRRCTVRLSFRNDGDGLATVDDDMVAAVVDGEYAGPLADDADLPVEVEPDRIATVVVEVGLFPRQALDAVAFDATRAESSSSTVVSVR
ncbi:hypothetical protein [Nocardioides litoris]|uniref:hypothetical protein n=1 Tax=Nocardioides litoris TaxID=1926648 RepID=UPI001120270F|nr:hypothetical protein [Nocardioides litoris]